ncbi:MAG: diguanylate cyclase domain-containing protein [Thermoanaerobaculia bacterium]
MGWPSNRGKEIRDFDTAREVVRGLSESEAAFRALVESSAAAVVLFNEEGEILYATPATSKLCGLEFQEIPGHRVTEFLEPADGDSVRQLFEDFAIRGRLEKEMELRCCSVDGTRKILNSVWANRLNDPAVSAIVATFRDVTEYRRGLALQSALYRIAAKASSVEEMSEFYASIHSIVGELLDAKNFYIALYDRAADLVTFPYFVDDADGSPEPMKPGRSLTGLVLRSGQPLFVTDETFHAMAARGEVDLVGAPSADWLGVPLKIGGQTTGVLAVQSYVPTNRYVESEKAVLTFVSQHIAAALEHKRAVEALRSSEERYRQLSERNQYLAFHDALTGLPNRALLADRLALALARTRREKQGVAVLFVDLDRFKDVNDFLGHEAGDRLLETVARRLKSCVRAEDTIARVGGDEFVLVLNRISGEAAARLVSAKILRTIAEPFEIGGQQLCATASIGLSLFPDHGSEPEDLIRHADAAMYAVKSSGRNACGVAPPRQAGGWARIGPERI